MDNNDEKIVVDEAQDAQQQQAQAMQQQQLAQAMQQQQSQQPQAGGSAMTQAAMQSLMSGQGPAM